MMMLMNVSEYNNVRIQLHTLQLPAVRQWVSYVVRGTLIIHTIAMGKMTIVGSFADIIECIVTIAAIVARIRIIHAWIDIAKGDLLYL